MEDEFEGMEDLIEEGDVFEVTEGVEDLEIPFWRVERKEIVSILKIATSIAQGSSDPISKSVLLEQKAEWLHFSMTNRDVYFKAKAKIKNVQNVLSEKFIMGIAQLNRIMQFAPELIIGKEDEKYFAFFMKGKQEIETFSFSTDVFSSPVMKDIKLTDVYVQDCETELLTLNRVLDLAASVEDRKITVDEGCAYGNFVSVLAQVKSNLPSGLVLKSLDIKNILLLLKLASGAIEIGFDSIRLYARGIGFRYSAFLIEAELAPEVKNQFKEGGWVKIGGVSGAHLAELFRYLAQTISDVSMAWVRVIDGVMKLSFKTRVGVEAEFVLTEDVDTEEEFGLQINLTKRVAEVLKVYPQVEIRRKEDKLCWVVEGCVIIEGIKEKV